MKMQAFPLCWPLGWKRSTRREAGSFEGKQEQVRRELLHEVALLIGCSNRSDVIISTNIPLRGDGEPYTDEGRLDDPGVAVYFKRKGKDICIASDKYDRVWKNMK